MITVQLAKRLMQCREVIPMPSGEHAGELQEIFNHPRFTLGSERDRHAIMQSSAYAKYKSELEYPWDHYFGTDLTSWLKGKSALDLGCFTGGRGVAWAERYGLASLIGVDVSEPYMTAAVEFSRSRNVPAEYRLATAEGLPLEDAAVDAVLSFDVFEHVQDVPRALEECRRVLKPGGQLFVVFPSYYQPMEHHLSLVTRCPGLQYLFSGQTLLKAYCEILDERGETADWYRRRSANLEYWERGNTINGTTLARFRRYVRQTRWTILRHSRKPIGSIGRNASKSLLLKGVACLCAPFAYLPALEEVFLHRISFILQKTD
ncbi:MAG: putative methyl transferase [Burkholderiales bacterium]|jgi:SAM-dependent methyltransferase|nr:putative methyl transferase [Burkholderiales bacterium]